MKPTIETDQPMPIGRRARAGWLNDLRETYARMKAGDSFLWPENKEPYRAAKQSGVIITTRKINAQGYRVWLRGKAKTH